MATNFQLAPPSKTVDGLLAVPIDIQTLLASFVFDGNTQTASGDATISYTVGNTAGNPIFDLRQNITNAWLDGAVFPVAQLALHDFGGGANTGLRIIESVQAAGSVHTLRVQYYLALPQSEINTGGYLPAIEWSAGPKLKFLFGFSDLRPGRYLESWLPANLIFDQFSIDLELQITNTLAAHSVITNGQLTSLGTNHWRVVFPARFTSLSTLLEIRAGDLVASQTDITVLPVSGKTVTIEVWKLLTSTTINLTTEINAIKGLLSDNENDYGAYEHDNRFVASFTGGGMEYEGGTITGVTSLTHETFHSWFARGIKPAAQSDGWWDEAFTTFHDEGADDAVAFDFTDPPILLCSRDPWQRVTPMNSYDDGSAFWKGVAALLGVDVLNTLMGDLYKKYRGSPITTMMIEEFLICKSGNADLVDAFHRFVYNFSNPSPAPDLWMKDAAAHTGTDFWNGAFWNSPDLWIRNQDDDLTTHQSPEYGQDNWFYTRVRNKSTAGTAHHFVVTFNAKSFAGTEFVYPGDFLPCIAAKAEFELAPGTTRIVKAKWPRSFVPPAGTHSCLLASVITRNDHPSNGLHVWEHNNLAQKNLTIVDLLPNTFIIIPVVLINVLREWDPRFTLEIWRERDKDDYEVALVHKSKEFFSLNKKAKLLPLSLQYEPVKQRTIEEPLDCGGHLHGTGKTDKKKLLTSDNIELIANRFPGAVQTLFPNTQNAVFPVELHPFNQTVAGLKIKVPATAKKGETFKLHFVQRNTKTKKVTGGISVLINVR